MNSRTRTANTENRMMDVREAAEYICMGITNARKLFKDIGAEKRIGRRAIYDRKIIDQYLDNLTDQKQAASQD